MPSVVLQKGNLLNAVTGTGAGAATVLDKIYRTFTFFKKITGAFTGLVVAFEGSLDGINWFSLGSDATTAAGVTFVVDKPCSYVRANVTTFTGGTNVSVDFVASYES